MLSARDRASLLLQAAHNVAMRSLALPDDTPLHKAADRHLDAMTLAVMYAFLKGRKAYKDGGDAPKAIRAALRESLPPVLRKAMATGGGVALSTMRSASLRTLKPQRPGKPHTKVGPIGLAFNVADPRAIKWAEERAAELADGLSETSREAIKIAVARAVAGDGVAAARTDILDAIGDEARARMIARTEVMTSANEGQRQGWQQAVDAGLLPQTALVEWIATAGCCDLCDELDGETRSLDGEYDDPDAGDGPPLHPNCRCTEGLAS